MADPISPFTPDMQAQISQLLQQQTDRSARTTPIHQAAMAMAQRMAPGYAQAAMTGGSSAPVGGGSLTPSSGGGSIGPGIGTTAAVTAFAALLKNPAFMAALKKMFGMGGDAWGPDGTFAGASTVNQPPGVPNGGSLPVSGSPNSPGGMNGTFPGYFTNPDGSTVPIAGDPANGGGYGGGVFPVESNTYVGGGQYGPFHD